MEQWVTVTAKGRRITGRKCDIAHYKRRRLERRLDLGLAEVVTVEEYLERHMGGKGDELQNER